MGNCTDYRYRKRALRCSGAKGGVWGAGGDAAMNAPASVAIAAWGWNTGHLTGGVLGTYNYGDEPFLPV